MIKESFFCMFVLLLLSSVFIQPCPPNQKQRKNSRRNTSIQSSNNDDPSGANTSPTAILPGFIRRKEIIFTPIKGRRLDECSYTEKRVGSIMDCAHLCLRENGQCLSINIEKRRGNGGYKCQLNNSTKEIHAQKFVKSAAYKYLEPKKAWMNGNPVSLEDIPGN